MKINDLKQIILDCCNDVVFVYNDLQSGITSEVRNYIPVFTMWHGKATKEYTSVDEMLSDRFFSGKSLAELVTFVEFTFS